MQFGASTGRQPRCLTEILQGRHKTQLLAKAHTKVAIGNDLQGPGTSGLSTPPRIFRQQCTPHHARGVVQHRTDEKVLVVVQRGHAIVTSFRHEASRHVRVIPGVSQVHFRVTVPITCRHRQPYIILRSTTSPRTHTITAHYDPRSMAAHRKHGIINPPVLAACLRHLPTLQRQKPGSHTSRPSCAPETASTVTPRRLYRSTAQHGLPNHTTSALLGAAGTVGAVVGHSTQSHMPVTSSHTTHTTRTLDIAVAPAGRYRCRRSAHPTRTRPATLRQHP